MTNSNCLTGFQCPECESFEPFKIEVITMVTMHDSGGWETESQQWDEESYCQCLACDFEGTVATFTRRTGQ